MQDFNFKLTLLFIFFNSGTCSPLWLLYSSGQDPTAEVDRWAPSLHLYFSLIPASVTVSLNSLQLLQAGWTPDDARQLQSCQLPGCPQTGIFRSSWGAEVGVCSTALCFKEITAADSVSTFYAAFENGRYSFFVCLLFWVYFAYKL